MSNARKCRNQSKSLRIPWAFMSVYGVSLHVACRRRRRNPHTFIHHRSTYLLRGQAVATSRTEACAACGRTFSATLITSRHGVGHLTTHSVQTAMSTTNSMGRSSSSLGRSMRSRRHCNALPDCNKVHTSRPGRMAMSRAYCALATSTKACDSRTPSCRQISSQATCSQEVEAAGCASSMRRSGIISAISICFRLPLFKEGHAPARCSTLVSMQALAVENSCDDTHCCTVS